MGVGKTTIGQVLKRGLNRSVFLDGDWCWDAHPFQVTEETKAVVTDNIVHVLNNFLHCTAYDHVIFTWVMDEQAILDGLLARLDTDGCRVRSLSLMCTPEALTERLETDIRAGKRERKILPRSLRRLEKYAALPTEKIDVSTLRPYEAARKIAGIAWQKDE